MTDPELERKLLQLDEYLQELRLWLEKDPSEFPSRARHRGLERMIQLVIECAADAGDLWLQAAGQPPGQSAGGVFQNLHQAGCMDDDMRDRFRRYVRARNRIVHDYDLVRPDEVALARQDWARTFHAL